MDENTNLKNFISKLNDRNLQRKRESGITSYVLLSVLMFCIYKLYKNLSFYILFNKDFSLTQSIQLVCFMSNALVAVYFIISTFQTNKMPFSNLKVIKYDKKNFNLFSYLILLFLYLIPIISTILSYKTQSSELSKNYYYVIGFLNFVLMVSLFEPFISTKKQLKIINSSDSSTGLIFTIFIISIFVIIYSLALAFDINLFEKFIFIKIIVLFYTILFILDKIVEQEKNDTYTINLENFEYEIYLKNLNDAEIRNILQENYIGYLIEYWIEFNTKEIKKFEEGINLKKIEINSKLSELEGKVNKTKYPIEFDARKNSIIESLKNEIEIKIPNFEKTLLDILKIIKDNNSLSELEVSQLNQLKSDLNLIIEDCKIIRY